MSSLNGIFSVAGSGLANANAQLALVSHNIANASTPGYALEQAGQTALSAGGVGFGVQTGVVTRDTDAALEAALNAQAGDVAGTQVTAAALANVDAAQGQVGDGQDLASQLGHLSAAFTTLGGDPANQAEQAAVVTAAGNLVDAIHTQAAAYTTELQTAQSGLVSDVTALNTAIHSIGALSDQIIAAKSAGQSTADLESQLAVQETTAAQLGGLQFVAQPNGDVLALAGGNVVNTRASSGPFSIAVGSSGNTGPPLLLAGQNVTGEITGGSIGARLALRDTTIPQLQAGLDEFTETLANRFSAQGLSLFTDPAGNVPASGGTPVQSGYIGFSQDVAVNPAVQASPNLVRDGTGSVAAGTGGAAGFTPNPASGPAGFTTLIDNVLQYALGSEAQPGVSQPAPNTSGLGASGRISLGFSPGNTLQSFAANLAAAQSQQASSAQTASTTAQQDQQTLQTKLSGETGVSIDTELSDMITLQNAYGANAKVLETAQTLWTDLLNAVGTAAA